MGNQPSAPKITPQDKAIFQLKQQRDKIKQYQKKLNHISNKQTELAKIAISKKQYDKAKIYLRFKKKQESMILTTFQQLDNLENLIGTIEFKLIEKDVIYGLEQGNLILKNLNKELNVDKIDKIMDDLADEKMKEEEISNVLGLNSGLNRNDEIEIDNEFEKLNKEINSTSKESDIKLPEVPKDKLMPDVPTGIETQKQEEEQEKSKEINQTESIAI
ncbi:VPS20 [Candida pseudojiufengensis]|uniref:VPS20 n=1 Tax=Candida pseudojiufengensis TaxID=497109 RepID=UPI002224B12B|nr:VPS20 [Candida pseudojiufengensis]KAI5958952.1 VPS20 [Candida pseudojiufengensis]